MNKAILLTAFLIGITFITSCRKCRTCIITDPGGAIYSEKSLCKSKDDLKKFENNSKAEAEALGTGYKSTCADN